MDRRWRIVFVLIEHLRQIFAFPLSRLIMNRLVVDHNLDSPGGTALCWHRLPFGLGMMSVRVGFDVVRAIRT